MIKRMRRSKNKGQGLVEFALVMPQLLLMLMGVIEFGWLVFNYTELYNGLREALRYGSVPSFTTTPSYEDCAGIRASIRNTAPQLGIPDNEITIQYDSGNYTNVMVADCQKGGPGGTFEPSGTTIQAGERIIVTIKHQGQFLTPVISTFAPNGFNISFTAARTIFP